MVLRTADKYNLIAHGTKRYKPHRARYSYTDGIQKSSPPRYRKALLSIMLDGEIREGNYGRLKMLLPGWDGIEAARYGPYYVVLDRRFKLNDVRIVYPIPATEHRIYLVPRENDAKVIINSLRAAVQIGTITFFLLGDSWFGGYNKLFSFALDIFDVKGFGGIIPTGNISAKQDRWFY